MKPCRALFLFPATFAALALLYMFGPVIDSNTDFNTPPVPREIGEIEEYFKNSESRFTDLRSGTEKTLVLRGGITEYSLVYLHGFTASRMETEPVTSIVAGKLDANVFFTRLKGHGHYQLDAQEGVKLSDWLYDAEEAFLAGSVIGRKVVLISCSTGAPLAAWLCMRHPDLIHSAVMISPNFRPADKRTGLLRLRWGPVLAKLIEHDVIGEKEKIISPRHAAGWSYIYRTEMLFPMMALLGIAEKIDYSKLQIPLLLFYSPDDKITDIRASLEVFGRWGSGKKKLVRVDNPGDRNSHIIAGDIFSPGTTDTVADEIAGFIRN